MFTNIDLETSLSEELKSVQHVAHCMLFFNLNEDQKQEIIRKSNCSDLSSSSFGLMQLRSDGLIGYPGGYIDEEINGFDDIILGLNRELKEEINCDLMTTKHDYAFTDYMEKKDGSNLILHFFVKKLTKEQFEKIELNQSKAIHYLTESLGIFRVPLKDQLFLDNFLKSDIFCGNSKDQLVRSIKMLNKNNEI